MKPQLNDLQEVTDKIENISISKYDCEHCGATYKVPWTLKSHVNKKHGKSIAEPEESLLSRDTNVFVKNKLPAKQLSNTNTAMVACSICKEVFFDPNKLNEHIRTHGDSSSSNTHSSRESVLLEKLSLNLKQVMDICDKCKEVFNDQEQFKEHMKSHLVCYVCKRLCTTVKQLNRHIKSHN